MNSILIFFIAIFIGFIMSIPVGPVGIISIKRTIEHGKWYGFFAGSGSVFSEALFASIVAFNIQYLSSFIQKNRMSIQVIGIIILTFVVVRMFFYDKHLKQKENRRDKILNVSSDFLYTFFINLTNPAVIITFIIFLSIFHIDHYLNFRFEQWAFVVGDFLGSLLWFFVLSSSVSYLHKKIKRDIIPLVYKTSAFLLLLCIFLFSLELFWEFFLK